MKTKQQIELEILSLKNKIDLQAKQKTNFFERVVMIHSHNLMIAKINALQWVLSDFHEPLTIQIDGQQTNPHNALNP